MSLVISVTPVCIGQVVPHNGFKPGQYRSAKEHRSIEHLIIGYREFSLAIKDISPHLGEESSESTPFSIELFWFLKFEAGLYSGLQGCILLLCQLELLADFFDIDSRSADSRSGGLLECHGSYY